MNERHYAAPAGSVLDAILQWALQTPHHLAVADGATTLNFQALAAAIDTTAQQYRAAGIRPGDRVGTALPDGAAALIGNKSLVKRLGHRRIGAGAVPFGVGHVHHAVLYQDASGEPAGR